jgi:beta-lactamase class A
MPRFQTSTLPKATLGRRQLLFAAATLGLTACERPMPLTASHTPRLNMGRLNAAAAKIAGRVKPAVLGAGLMNLESGETWSFNGERPFPMQSVFKLPLAAAALAEVDAGRLSLSEGVILEAKDLSPPYSPIAEAWPARRDYTLLQLLTAALMASDNTAADMLMKRIGGPGAVTAWLQSKQLNEVRVDRYERELQPEISGLASFRPAWRGPAFRQVRDTLPVAVRREAMTRYLTDPRDTATPRGMLDFLDKLDGLELVSAASTKTLLQILTAVPGGAGRLKAALPRGASLAHKPGTAGADLGLNPIVNDVGILTRADARRYAVAAFLSGSSLDQAGSEMAIADLGRAVVAAVG